MSTSDLDFEDIEHFGDDVSLLADDDLEPEPQVESSSNFLSSLTSSWFSLGFLEPYFDVTTELIVSRLRKAVYPRQQFFEDNEQADFYGPFWTATTLIVAVSTMSNWADYMNSTAGAVWKTDYMRISTAATVLYLWISLVPIAAWFLFKHIAQADIPLPKLISLYGYSLISYFPASILCVLNISLLSWLVCLVCFAHSSLFLFANLQHIIATENQVRSYPVLGVIICLQFAFMLVFKLDFFNY